MNLTILPKITAKRKKRLGQGLGSGHGKTSGRGTKGQKARRSIKLSFEGGALPLIKRLPALRGKFRNKVFRSKEIAINLGQLSFLPKNTKVDIETLIKHNIVDKDARKLGVKILSNGEVSIPLTVSVLVSFKAREKIEKAGGTVET